METCGGGVAVPAQASESWLIRIDRAFQEGAFKETGTKTQHSGWGWIEVLQQ